MTKNSLSDDRTTINSHEYKEDKKNFNDSELYHCITNAQAICTSWQYTSFADMPTKDLEMILNGIFVTIDDILQKALKIGEKNNLF